ncbi:MAG TPA: hypothetical protein VG274_04285 [Rhizomicrobium sp.]|nr:hypothetical protein [Rhizomicrobium sp.]
MAIVVQIGRAQAQATTQPEPIELRVRPMALAEPALKDRLLPPYSEQTPGNAATLYLTAFSLVQSNSDSWDQKRSDEFDELLDASIDDLDAEKARRFLVPNVFDLLEIAGRRSRCEWDTSMREQGYRALLPYLNQARTAANLLSIQIKLDIKQGDFDHAIRMLRSGFAMANHLETEPILVQCLVAAGIRDVMLSDVRALIQRPNAPNLYWPLADLYGSRDLWPRIMESEREALFYTIPRLRHPEDLTAEQARKVIEEINGYIEPSRGSDLQEALGRDAATLLQIIRAYPLAREALIRRGTPAAQVDAIPANAATLAWDVDGFQRRADAIERWTCLAPWQAFAGLRREALRHREDDDLNPLNRLIPRVSLAYLTLARGDRERALMQMVEAVRGYAAAHGGSAPASLDDLSPDTPAPPDPLLGKGFDYSVEHGIVTLHAAAVPGDGQISEAVFHIQIER